MEHLGSGILIFILVGILVIGALTVVLPFLTCLVLLIWGGGQLKQTWIRGAWQKLALRLELSRSPEGHWRGRHQGLPVEVRFEGRTSLVCMAFQGQLPFHLHLSRQQPGRKLPPGVRDLQVGDKRLDDAVLVQAENPAATIRLLREPAVRDAVLRFLEAFPKSVVTGRQVVVPLAGKPTEASVREILRAQHQVASELDAAIRRLQERKAVAAAHARLGSGE